MLVVALKTFDQCNFHHSCIDVIAYLSILTIVNSFYVQYIYIFRNISILSSYSERVIKLCSHVSLCNRNNSFFTNFRFADDDIIFEKSMDLTDTSNWMKICSMGHSEEENFQQKKIYFLNTQKKLFLGAKVAVFSMIPLANTRYAFLYVLGLRIIFFAHSVALSAYLAPCS